MWGLFCLQNEKNGLTRTVKQLQTNPVRVDMNLSSDNSQTHRFGKPSLQCNCAKPLIRIKMVIQKLEAQCPHNNNIPTLLHRKHLHVRSWSDVRTGSITTGNVMSKFYLTSSASVSQSKAAASHFLPRVLHVTSVVYWRFQPFLFSILKVHRIPFTCIMSHSRIHLQ